MVDRYSTFIRPPQVTHPGSKLAGFPGLLAERKDPGRWHRGRHVGAAIAIPSNMLAGRSRVTIAGRGQFPSCQATNLTRRRW